MEITFTNRNDRSIETLFSGLTEEVFGLSFRKWHDLGVWDERYECYSVITGQKMIANVSLYKADMLVQGKSLRAHSLSAVATSREWRGEGLSRMLMEHVLGKYPDTPFYLTANPGVLDFYPRFGFRRVYMSEPSIEVHINNKGVTAERLAAGSDRLAERLSGRAVFSAALDFTNTVPVQLFNLLMEYAEDIYDLTGCPAVVVAKQDGETLFIADVIPRAPISWDELAPCLPFTGVRKVVFGFCPDRLNIRPDWRVMEEGKSAMFVRGDLPLPAQFRLTITSVT